MKQITYSQLAEIVSNKKGVSFVGLSTLTDARAKKTGKKRFRTFSHVSAMNVNNPFGTILKKSRFVGVSGADYESAANRAGADSFKADSLPWGEFVAGSGRKLISHKGALYLRLQTTGKQRARKGSAIVKYYGQGKELTHEQVKPFLPPTNSAKQSAHGVELESQVQVRTFSFESIQVVRINGQSFQLVKD